MAQDWNIVLLITDGHGHYTSDADWGTKEFSLLKQRFDSLDLAEEGYIRFTNVVSPAVSTIMSIESIMSGLYAAKTHKMHWREWPTWDRFNHPVLSSFLEERGYEVNGFSYLLNSKNWLPSIRCYRPDIYNDFPSHKRDTHSHEAVLAAVKHFFANAHRTGGKQFLIVHSIFIFDMWSELMEEFRGHGLTEENTIFAFTSDHYFPKNFGRSWLLGERDSSLLFHHSDLTEYNTRVFFYLKYPGATEGEFAMPVSGYDIAPTLLDLIGLIDEWPASFDGTSLCPLLRGGDLPERVLRTDNVYPYQIGEKQGRITALRSGRYKFVSRLDTASSYIAYRMSEEWSVVLNKEELYDIDTDPEEKINLITSSDTVVREETTKLRNALTTTNDAVYSFHEKALLAVCLHNSLVETLARGKKQGRILIIQSSSEEVFVSIIRVVAGILSEWDMDVVVKKNGTIRLPLLGKTFIYPDSAAYRPEILTGLLGSGHGQGYDCIINTSNFPLGDYLSVYDESRHPVGDFTVSSKVMRTLSAPVKGSLCLDMSFTPLSRTCCGALHRVQNPSAIFKAVVRFSVRKIVRYFGARLSRCLADRSKINPYLAERIIHAEQGFNE